MLNRSDVSTIAALNPHAPAAQEAAARVQGYTAAAAGTAGGAGMLRSGSLGARNSRGSYGGDGVRDGLGEATLSAYAGARGHVGGSLSGVVGAGVTSPTGTSKPPLAPPRASGAAGGLGRADAVADIRVADGGGGRDGQGDGEEDEYADDKFESEYEDDFEDDGEGEERGSGGQEEEDRDGDGAGHVETAAALRQSVAALNSLVQMKIEVGGGWVATGSAALYRGLTYLAVSLRRVLLQSGHASLANSPVESSNGCLTCDTQPQEVSRSRQLQQHSRTEPSAAAAAARRSSTSSLGAAAAATAATGRLLASMSLIGADEEGDRGHHPGGGYRYSALHRLAMYYCLPLLLSRTPSRRTNRSALLPDIVTWAIFSLRHERRPGPWRVQPHGRPAAVGPGVPCAPGRRPARTRGSPPRNQHGRAPRGTGAGGARRHGTCLGRPAAVGQGRGAQGGQDGAGRAAGEAAAGG